MKSYCVTSERLQNFGCLVWVSTDTAVAVCHLDHCLYEIVLPPSLKGIRASKISQPFESSILSIAALIPGCGAGPSSAVNAPTSQPNQKSPFQLSRSTGQSSDFGQTIIVIGCANGTIGFLYADLVQLGGQGQRINIRRTKVYNLKEFVQSPDDVLPITALCMAQPRGAQLLVGTETGYILLFALTGGQFQFKQLLRSDTNAPIHAIVSLSRSHFCFGSKNQIQIVNINRPQSSETVYKIADGNAVTTLAVNNNVLAIGAEHAGLIFYDLIQNFEISVFPAPPGDAISALSVSSTTEEFIAASRRGAIMVFRRNGILREISHTSESQPQDNTPQYPGGISEILFAPYGGVFLCLCQAGFCYGAVYFQRISAGGCVFEPASESQVRIVDNNLQINDVYNAPEPITNLCQSGGVFVATTATSVIVWRPPNADQVRQLKGSTQSAVVKNQWIQEPLRTQSFSEQVYNKGDEQSGKHEEENQIQIQIVGGVQFGVFNFNKTEEQAARAAIQDQYSPACRSGIYIRHSVQFAKASESYLLLQDISGECHICQINTLNLIHTLYNGQCYESNLQITDQLISFNEGPILRVCETATGNYIIKQLVHQRKILQLAISSIKQRGMAQETTTQQPQITLGNMFNDITGTGAGQMAHAGSVGQEKDIVLALLDSSNAVFVSQFRSSEYYQKFTQTNHVFNQLSLNAKVLSITFPPGSQILTLLCQDSSSLPAPTNFIGAQDNPDYQTRLRLILFGQPIDYNINLPLPMFVSPVAVSTAGLLRSCAQMSFEEIVDNSSRQIQQYKLLCKQTAYQIMKVNPSIRENSEVASIINCSNCCVSLLSGSCFVVVPLPEFPLLLEQYQSQGEINQRLCRYVQQPALWSLECYYCKKHQNAAGLKLALAAVGQVPKAIYEAETASIEVLLQQGKIGRAVQQCCDLWDFERAREIISKDRRFGPLLIYLRRQMHAELGTMADEKNEPWLSLSREFGDRAMESCLDMIEK